MLSNTGSHLGGALLRLRIHSGLMGSRATILKYLLAQSYSADILPFRSGSWKFGLTF